MAKSTSVYVCQVCAARYPKWLGRCDGCGEWNQIAEEAATVAIPKGLKPGSGRRFEFSNLQAQSQDYHRQSTHMAEFDRVCGGGLVPGSVTLVGGDPGIGKSTLLLQLAAKLSGAHSVAYISGEEGLEQIRMRALRLGVQQAEVQLASATNMRDIVSTLESMPNLEVVIVDSIQTMFVDNIEASPGTVTQVRACAQELIRLAKHRQMSIILVSHVTKEGVIAGPRTLEHMVDTVLYFEGDRSHQFRILRTVKNRYGPTDEIGVFSMAEQGLVEVPNPSQLFLQERAGDVAGTIVYAGMEGTRPILVEIQALISTSPYPTPRRNVVGWDPNRLAMILAILEARCGLKLGDRDIYLNVVGGFRIQDTGADIAVMAALISAFTLIPIDHHCIAFGEVGLTGEVRLVNHAAARLKEAAKLGFKTALVPVVRTEKATKGGASPVPQDGLTHQVLKHAFDLVTLLAQGDKVASPQMKVT